jgi:alpha-mannosidase
VGTISRGDGLATRPLRAGPPLETPEGQCPGTHAFEYALRLDGEELDDAALLRAAQDYRTDFVPVRGFDEKPPLSIEGDLVFSALKGAEDGDGVVLRLFNPGSEPAEAVVNGTVETARLRLDETEEEAVAANRTAVDPGEIATLRLRRAARAVLGA